MIKNRKRIIDFLFLFVSLFVYSWAGIFAKLAAKQELFYMTVLLLGVEVLVLAVFALMWQQILKRFHLITAVSCKGITVLFALLWSAILFRESITIWNMVGAAIIISGIWVVASDD